MAIQPIDLQTLFTQIDKVGKDQSVLREGHQIQSALQSARLEQRELQRDHSVNETQDTGQGGAGRVNERPSRRRNGKEFLTKEGEDNEEGEDEDPSVIRDPYLGRNLDVSG
ncbi:MAG: hypothetical protein LBT16_07400 [Treponema sp.]|jgi:hypothetical protein|nr:hypothetical protein [Treponema sp.]